MLGRGLESLIPNKSVADSARESQREGGSRMTVVPGGEAVFQIEIDRIVPNPHQPRKNFDEEALLELAASIRELGIIQPLVVTKAEKETERGLEPEYQLIAGERRLRAAKIAGLSTVPVIIKKVGEEKEKLELAIVENLQRDNLDSIEAARSYAKLQEEFGLTQREVAQRVGKSREVVANALRLLNLPTPIQEALSQGKLSDSQARILLAVTDPREQERLFQDTLQNNLSVRELKARVSRVKDGEKGQGKLSMLEPRLAFFEERLKASLQTKVTLKTSGNGGEIRIQYFSPEELEEIAQKILDRDI